MNKERLMAIVRVIALFITAINALLVAAGKVPFPFDESAFYEGTSYIVAAIVAIWSWWKNNNITIEAQLGQKVINQLKGDRMLAGGGDTDTNSDIFHEMDDPKDPEVK